MANKLKAGKKRSTTRINPNNESTNKKQKLITKAKKRHKQVNSDNESTNKKTKTA